MKLLQKLAADPRHFQILTLSILLGIQVFWGDFAPAPQLIALTLSSILIIQWLFEHKYSVKHDLRSPLITGLSLCLLLRVAEWWLYPAATLLAVGTKFLIRHDNKHVFNPANIAIVTLLIAAPHYSWVSPGQWGTEVWFIFLLACLAFLVLYRIQKADIALFFFGSFAAMLFARALWLGDPLAIPLHQIQSGALLIFAFFMISDPMTTPNHRLGRFIFALAVAATAFTLQFGFQVREGLFYALAFVSMTTPFLDKLMHAPKYQWGHEWRKT